MTKKRYQTIEKPSGKGEVHKEGKYLATVRYRLLVRQEIIISETFGDTEEIPGFLHVSGKVTVLKGERDLQAHKHPQLLLSLSDGRHMEFWAKDGGPGNGVYTISPAGSKGLTN